MLAYQIPSSTIEQTAVGLTPDFPNETWELPNSARGSKAIRNENMVQDAPLTLQSRYKHRQANHEIGRAAEKKEAEAQRRGKTTRKFPEFQPGDRFRAWRRRSERITRNKAMKATKRSSKGKK